MRELYESIREHVAEILAEWDGITRQQEPWSALPTDERIDHLAPLVLDVAEASLRRPHSLEGHERELLTAAEHGRYRREQGFHSDVITKEYYFIRQAIWRYIKKVEPEGKRRFEAIRNIDTSLMLVTRAGLFGYHRPELEKQGRWPAAVHELVRESPFLGPQE